MFLGYLLILFVCRQIYIKYYEKIKADEYYSIKKNIQASSMQNEYVVEERVLECDLLRGLFIILFIVVNTGGGRYIFLNESVWDGMKLGDLPELGIAWVTGFSAPFLIKYKAKNFKNTRSFINFLLIKCSILFAFGLSYNGNFNLSKFLTTGFFQRLSLAILINTLVVYFVPFVKHETERAEP